MTLFLNMLLVALEHYYDCCNLRQVAKLTAVFRYGVPSVGVLFRGILYCNHFLGGWPHSHVMLVTYPDRCRSSWGPHLWCGRAQLAVCDGFSLEISPIASLARAPRDDAAPWSRAAIDDGVRAGEWHICFTFKQIKMLVFGLKSTLRSGVGTNRLDRLLEGSG